ncbi:MAG: hypothetical protein LBP53_07110 [Candidatus Peribacteria bacterium]|nr:hypothetical protein [Candidatus Peribacteria bacterium]
MQNVTVSGYANEQISIQLSGTDADGASLVYVISGTEYLTPTFTGTWATSATLEYVAYKTGDDCGTKIFSNTGTIVITISSRPSSGGG